MLGFKIKNMMERNLDEFPHNISLFSKEGKELRANSRLLGGASVKLAKYKCKNLHFQKTSWRMIIKMLRYIYYGEVDMEVDQVETFVTFCETYRIRYISKAAILKFMRMSISSSEESDFQTTVKEYIRIKGEQNLLLPDCFLEPIQPLNPKTCKKELVTYKNIKPTIEDVFCTNHQQEEYLKAIEKKDFSEVAGKFVDQIVNFSAEMGELSVQYNFDLKNRKKFQEEYIWSSHQTEHFQNPEQKQKNKEFIENIINDLVETSQNVGEMLVEVTLRQQKRKNEEFIENILDDLVKHSENVGERQNERKRQRMN